MPIPAAIVINQGTEMAYSGMGKARFYTFSVAAWKRHGPDNRRWNWRTPADKFHFADAPCLIDTKGVMGPLSLPLSVPFKAYFYVFA